MVARVPPRAPAGGQHGRAGNPQRLTEEKTRGERRDRRPAALRGHLCGVRLQRVVQQAKAQPRRVAPWRRPAPVRGASDGSERGAQLPAAGACQAGLAEPAQQRP